MSNKPEENKSEESNFATRKIDAEELMTEESSPKKTARKPRASKAKISASDEIPEGEATIKVDAEEVLSEKKISEPVSGEIQELNKESPSPVILDKGELPMESDVKQSREISSRTIWLVVIIGIIAIFLASICSCAALFGYLIYNIQFF